MSPRKQNQNNTEGHTPLEIPAIKNDGWRVLAEKMRAHTKDMEILSRPGEGFRVPNGHFDFRFDYGGAGIQNLFDRAASASNATHCLTIPPGGFNLTDPETALATIGQMDPEQPKP